MLGRASSLLRLFAPALLMLVSGPAAMASERPADECVILLHGLARGSGSMNKLAVALEEAGYAVSNVDYPSRSEPIEALAPPAVETGLKACREAAAKRIHFVTHSMGGILVRQFLSERPIPELGRVVMLAPPNRGSEVVDRLRRVPGFGLINGPAGAQLGTGEESVPLRLGPATFELGVIAGSRTVNPILSSYLPDPDDGKVSVESARLEGMRDFIVLPYSHTFIMRRAETIRQTLYFLVHGRFDHPAPRGDAGETLPAP